MKDLVAEELRLVDIRRKRCHAGLPGSNWLVAFSSKFALKLNGFQCPLKQKKVDGTEGCFSFVEGLQHNKGN